MNGGRCVARKLFFDNWHWRVPEMYFYTEKFLQEAGYLHSGDKTVDRMMMTSMRDVYRPIAAAALFYAEGARIELVNRADAIPIYNLIVEHLRNWKFVTESMVNGPKPPIEDLKKFDALAAGLHYMACDAPQIGLPSDSIFNRIMEINQQSLAFHAGPVKGGVDPATGKVVESTVPKNHTPYADAIARRYRKGG